MRATHKYGAKWVTLRGPDGRDIKFQSRAEAGHIVALWLRAEAGEIVGLELQPKYAIHVAGQNGPVFAFNYIADASFVVAETNAHHVDDVKGMDTDLSKLKRRCVRGQYGIDVSIIKVRAAQANRMIALWNARATKRRAA